MHTHNIGSFAWIKQSHGQLSWQEKVKLIQKSLRPTSLHIYHSLFTAKTTLDVAFQDIKIPDTAIIKEAVSYVEQQLNLDVLAHSWRSYYWGYALAQKDHLDFDAETFLLSALFHDVALGKEHSEHCQCFTYHSAIIAEQWLNHQHYPTASTANICDSICLHMNGHETHNQTSEVRLLQRGTSCDVIGQHLYLLPKALQQQVWQHYPIGDFYPFFIQAIDFESQHYPNSRVALLKQLGLPLLIKQFIKQQAKHGHKF